MAYFQSAVNGKAVNIYYEDYGKGRPVVLVHGWPLDHQMWEYQALALHEAGYRVISYDRRGFGKSDKPMDGYDYKTLTADLANLFEHLDLQDAVLVGFSMAGGEVVSYLSQKPARVSKGVLIGSIAPFMLKTKDNPDGVPEEMMDAMLAGIEKDRPKFIADFSKAFYGVGMLSHPVSQERLEVNLNIAMQAGLKATLDCVRSFMATDLRAETAGIQVPVLLIHGDSDKSVPLEVSSEKAAKLIPNAKLLVYKGQPHGLYLTDKERLNKDLLEFIAGS